MSRGQGISKIKIAAIVVLALLFLGSLSKCMNTVVDSSYKAQEESSSEQNSSETAKTDAAKAYAAKADVFQAEAEKPLHSSSPTDADLKEDSGPVDSPSIFDPSSYGIETSDASSNKLYKCIISAYGGSESDFPAMRQFVIDAAQYYGLSEDAETVGAEFDSIIGTEGGSGNTWSDGGIITSAPNGNERFYRVDLYVAA